MCRRTLDLAAASVSHQHAGCSHRRRRISAAARADCNHAPGCPAVLTGLPVVPPEKYDTLMSKVVVGLSSRFSGGAQPRTDGAWCSRHCCSCTAGHGYAAAAASEAEGTFVHHLGGCRVCACVMIVWVWGRAGNRVARSAPEQGAEACSVANALGCTAAGVYMPKSEDGMTKGWAFVEFNRKEVRCQRRVARESACWGAGRGNLGIRAHVALSLVWDGTMPGPPSP